MGELAPRNKPIGLVTYINTHLSINDLNNGTFDQLTVSDTHKSLLECFRKRGVRRFRLCNRFFIRCSVFRCSGFCDGSRCLFCFRSHRLFQFAHSGYNLHNHPLRRRCARNNTYYIITFYYFKYKFVRICNRLYFFTVFFAYSSKFLRIGAVRSAYNNHCSAFFGQPFGLLLPFPCRVAYSIKHF